MLAVLNTTVSRIRGLFSGRSQDEDFDQEVQAHLEMFTEENIRSGMTPDQARRAALVRFGGVTQIRESQRDHRGLPQIETFLQDVRYAVRGFRKSPGFTLVAVLTLALGIGLNTTLFTAYNAVALRPLPVKDPRTVVRLERWFQDSSLGDLQYAFSYPEYVYYRDHTRSLSNLVAASWPTSILLNATDAAQSTASAAIEHARGQLVSGNYFADLGISASLGRTFLPEENQTPGAHPVIVLSFPFWQRRFNSDPLILGRVLKLNKTDFTIVGVTPKEFIGTANPPVIPDFWAPLMMQPQLVPGSDWLNEAANHQFQILARPRPGIGRKQAQSEAQILALQFGSTYTELDKTVALTLAPAVFFGGTDDIRFQAFVALLMVVVGMVLLVACANLANMLLARAAGRQREIGVRLALGANRRRVIRQLLTENILLALLGGAVGLIFSVWASQLLWVAVRQALMGQAELVVQMTPDIRIYCYALLLSVATGVLFGLSPALRFTRPDLIASLKDEGSNMGQRITRSRLRGFLVGGQVAVSMLLLITSGLFLRALLKSQVADPGYQTKNVFMAFVEVGTDPVKARALERRVIDRWTQLPELKGLASVDRFPMSGTWTPPLKVEDSKAPPASLPKGTLANYVTPGYFQTLEIPLLRGRNFTSMECETKSPLAIVSESAARVFWPDDDPIGKRFKLDTKFHRRFDAEFQVIGVAKDVRNANLSRIDPTYVYLPFPSSGDGAFLIRLQAPVNGAIAALRASLDSIDPNLSPGMRFINFEEGPLQIQRLMARTMAMFALLLAGVALGLAAVGIYGVMSYLVSQRTREIGIRMALGASAAGVLRSVIQQGLRPVFIGAGVGLAAALGVSSVLKHMLAFPSSPDLLFGVSVFDPLTFVGFSLFLAMVAALASAIPALRATKVDPMEALRYE
ncbi:MAG TPA: ABC transporter permease [Bryobacteraceae bacterium]|nr:ABC transporter permease [Bryobacteraceae bacterium]